LLDAALTVLITYLRKPAEALHGEATQILRSLSVAPREGLVGRARRKSGMAEI
jgi:hypothetical protein